MKTVEDISVDSEMNLQREAICFLLSHRDVDNDDPLSQKEIEQATIYWEMFVGNPIGERESCGCHQETPKSSGILTDNLEQTRRAVRTHLELGVASKCPECSNQHFILSEALSYHSEFLRCQAKKDSRGALRAARKRSYLVQSLSEQKG